MTQVLSWQGDNRVAVDLESLPAVSWHTENRVYTLRDDGVTVESLPHECEPNESAMAAQILNLQARLAEATERAETLAHFIRAWMVTCDGLKRDMLGAVYPR